MTEHLLKPAEVAEQLLISDDTLYRLINEHQITAYRISGQWRLFQSDVDTYILSCRQSRQTVHASAPTLPSEAKRRGRPAANASGYYPGMKVV